MGHLGPLTVDIICDLAEGSGLDVGAQAETPGPLTSLSKWGYSHGPQDGSEVSGADSSQGQGRCIVSWVQGLVCLCDMGA